MKEIMSEENIKGDEIGDEESKSKEEGREKLSERLIKNKEVLKKVLKRMVVWGMITGSALVATKSGYAEKYIQESYSQSVGDSTEKDKRGNIEFKESESTLIVKNFEKIGISSEMLKQLWSEGYPENWVNNEIDTVVFEDTTKDGPAGSYTRGKVTIYKNAGVDLRTIDKVFAHESGHDNDWYEDETIFGKDNVELLNNVSKRYLSGKKTYYSVYLGSIDETNISREIKEYWAEICGEYFSNPDWFLKNYPEDFKLVHEWVTKQDSKFDPFEAKLKREGIIISYEENKNNFFDKERKLFECFPSDVRQKLTELLQGYNQKRENCDFKEIEQMKEEYTHKKDKIINSYEANSFLNSVSPEMRKALEQLREKYIQKIEVLKDKNDQEGLTQIDKDLSKDLEFIGKEFNLSQEEFNKLERIMFKEITSNIFD